MANKTPQNEAFIKSKNYAYAELILDALAFVISLLQSLCDLVSDEFFIGVALLFVIANYFISKFKYEQFEKASNIRLKWVMDSSFGINRIQGYDSSKYFDNDDIDIGFKKLFANTHENTLFTSEISNETYKCYSVISIMLIAITVVIFVFSGTNKFTSLLLNAVLTGRFFERARVVKTISEQTNQLFNNFNDVCGKYDKNEDYEMVKICGIELIIRYESLIVENKYVQSERIFEKKNTELTKKWNEIKEEYLIYREV